MAQANIGSRRANEDLIRQGRVRVNGKACKLGDQADPRTDVIEVDGVKLDLVPQRKIYIALNKPMNVLSTNVGRRDDGRKTVRSLVPVEGHLFTIGRLDTESEGLMVLTNDGELTHRLTHPRYGHTKTYRATVYGLPSRETIEKWQNGVYLEEGKTAPCSVRIAKGGRDLSTLEIVMAEGKKRQIRRVASLLGHPVKRLVRTHIGKLALGALHSGEWRELSARDIATMQIPAMEIEKPRYERRARPIAHESRASSQKSPQRPRRRNTPAARSGRRGVARTGGDNRQGASKRSRPPQRRTPRRRSE